MNEGGMQYVIGSTMRVQSGYIILFWRREPLFHSVYNMVIKEMLKWITICMYNYESF